MISRPPWAAEPELSVFVNCPFDPAFRRSLDAIIFTCVHAGFFPWMAGSTGTIAIPRLERILEGLMWCRYSVHDLSRYKGEGPDNLARFNMPLDEYSARKLALDESWADKTPWGRVIDLAIEVALL